MTATNHQADAVPVEPPSAPSDRIAVTGSDHPATRAGSVLLVAIIASTLAACGGGGGETATTTAPAFAPATTTLAPTETEERSQVELRLTVGGAVLRATRLDSETTRDFIFAAAAHADAERLRADREGQRSSKTAVDRGRAGRRRPRHRRHHVLRAVGEPRDLLQGLRLLERSREARHHRVWRRRARSYDW
jgi:hypothetical protein